jgi:hypothetical protein
MTAPNEATGVWPLSSAMAPLGVLSLNPPAGFRQRLDGSAGR